VAYKKYNAFIIFTFALICSQYAFNALEADFFWQFEQYTTGISGPYWVVNSLGSTQD